MIKKILVPYKIILSFVFLLIFFLGCQSDYHKIQKDVMIPLKDGTKLASNIFLPDKSGSFPVILVRTPYGKDIEEDEEDNEGGWWADNGYAFVIQDCRGTGNSEGEWYPGIFEKEDGIDTREWILQQPWCNGSIGTTGGSYLGFTQFASCTESNASLKAMFPYIPAMNMYDDVSFIDGAFSLGTVMGWGLVMANPAEGEGSRIDEENADWDQIYRTLPLIDFDNNVDTTLVWMRDWIVKPLSSRWWDKLRNSDLNLSCSVPLITVSGWYDVFVQQALDYHQDAIQRGKENQYLIVGPWGHGPNHIPGDREMAENHELDFGDLQIKWFDHWLKGNDVKIDLSPVKIYVMGKNKWRNENEWPLKRTQYIPYYFHSKGKANTLSGNGIISVKKPGREPTDQFIYDPGNPVPTLGGAILFYDFGAFDQREIEKREDVLVYTSAVLEEELEVTGPVKVILYASSDARDTDWTAKMVDVYPDGRAFNLCDGVIRARYHKDPLKPELIKPDKVYKYEIDLWATSNVFLPGHRIRVEISSSNFPRFDRNPNTGNAFGMDTELREAEQTVYHNDRYPSHVILPVIPAASDKQ